MRSPSLDYASTPVGPNIVKAWFESAINPLLIGLENEAALLRSGTYTWRAHSRQMLAILPVRSHVPYGTWANLDQFLSFYHEIAEMCRAHDLAVAELAKACGQVYDSLIANHDFKNVVRTVNSGQISVLLDAGPLQTLFLLHYFEQTQQIGTERGGALVREQRSKMAEFGNNRDWS
jgi:hypothetical protein